MIHSDGQAWLRAFDADPGRELAALLSGAASISPYQRAEPNDALVAAFAGLPDGHVSLDRLDDALRGWLADRLAEGPEAVEETGWNAYVSEIREALATAVRLPLRAKAALLRTRFDAITAWTEELSDPEAIDLRARYWRTLTHLQTGCRFLGLWRRCCRLAGHPDGLPDAYLDIGLAGLRLMPAASAKEAMPSDDLLGGLFAWAGRLERDAARECGFRDRWRALVGLYPRGPNYWHGRLAGRLDEQAGRPFAAWLRDEIGLPAPAAARPLRKPTKQETDNQLRQLERAPDDGRREQLIEQFAARYRAYAEATGDWHHLPRAFNRLGNAVLDPRPDMALALAREALEFDPLMGHNWILWSKALQGLGRARQAEAVLWEATRRLPDNAHCPVELAHLLATEGRPAEAEALYRATMRQHPRDVVSRFDFALLLVEKGRLDDAAAIEAELRPLNRRRTKDLAWHIDDARHGRGEAVPAKVERIPTPPPPANDDSWNGLDGTARAVRADFLLSEALSAPNLLLVTNEIREELRAEARRTLAELLADRPWHPVVRLIARRHGMAPEADEAALLARAEASPGDYGLALELARRDGSRFQKMFDDFAEMRPLTALAWLADTATVPKIEEFFRDWLYRKPDDTTDPVLADLNRRLRGLLGDRLPANLDPRQVIEMFDETPLIDDGVRDDLLDIAVLGLVARELPFGALYDEAA